MSEEDFRVWTSGRGPHVPLAVKGHTFVAGAGASAPINIIKVDGGTFVYEEALELVRMLNSPNPLDKITASIAIWERNGVLRLIVLGLVAVVVLVVIALLL